MIGVQAYRCQELNVYGILLNVLRDNTLNNFVSVIRLNVYGIILSQLGQVRQRELRINVICKWHG